MGRLSRRRPPGHLLPRRLRFRCRLARSLLTLAGLAAHEPAA
ncbi:MAG: hypothetical protein ACRDRJ_51735 [Streptosporangiaceae bacterium]